MNSNAYTIAPLAASETVKAAFVRNGTITDYQRGYYEARGMIGHTYMSNRCKWSFPEWYDHESEEYKRGFRAGIASLAVC